MKGIILFVLLTSTVALYLGYGPYDLVLLNPTTSAPAVKHAHVPTEQATEQTPAPRNTSIIVAEAPDGSLEHRWPKTVATSTPSPAKQ